MTDRELMQQALEALDWAADCIEPRKPFNCDCPVCVASDALRDRLAQPQRTHWEGCEEVHPECRKTRREWVGLTDEEWAALWEKFALESEFTIDEEFQEQMVKKHGQGHYYMDKDEAWNRQKDMIQKLVIDKLREKSA